MSTYYRAVIELSKSGLSSSPSFINNSISPIESRVSAVAGRFWGLNICGLETIYLRYVWYCGPMLRFSLWWGNWNNIWNQLQTVDWAVLLIESLTCSVRRKMFYVIYFCHQYIARLSPIKFVSTMVVVSTFIHTRCINYSLIISEVNMKNTFTMIE